MRGHHCRIAARVHTGAHARRAGSQRLHRHPIATHLHRRLCPTLFLPEIGIQGRTAVVEWSVHAYARGRTRSREIAFFSAPGNGRSQYRRRMRLNTCVVSLAMGVFLLSAGTSEASSMWPSKHHLTL